MGQRVGLLGWPLGHSVSPAMHNAAFAALGLDWRYEALPVPPSQFTARVTSWLAEGFRGFNVTVPHKRAALALPQVTETDPPIETIGAANTLTRLPDGTLRASNTDWQGFADDLRAHGVTVNNQRCLVLGTGGAAQAVAYALRQMGAAAITYTSRHPEGRPGTISYADLARYIHEITLIVNSTPVGMVPHGDESPWPPNVPWPDNAVLYDLIYNPPVTRLMALADAAGLQTIGGLGMLVRQGALSFELWTGITPALDVMEQAARQALSET